jgi:predicted Zn-dependent peptidase
VRGPTPLSAFGPAAVALLVLASAAAPSSAQATPGESLPVREIVLDNGMRVLVLPRAGAPTVSFVVRFGVGGVHERLGSTGIAHLLEHMLFKGTESVGTRNPDAERQLFGLMDSAHDSLLLARAGRDEVESERLIARIDALEDSARTFVESNEFDRILSRAGAQGLNATTTSESTIYFVELPSNRTELWFALEADRMSNPVFREFYSERDVVTEERRMRIESVPGGVLYETHLGVAFTMHPYGVPVVGYMSDLETLSRRDVESYYRRFYGPNNAVVAIVGDLDPHQIEGWAREYLGGIPMGEDPPPVLAVEPTQLGERRVEVEWDAEPQVRMGWHVPSSLHDDAPALAILTSLLTGGRTSRLYKRLILEDRVSTGIFSSLGPGSLYPQLLQIDATPLAPASTETVEAAIYDEVARLVAEGPTQTELIRVRNQIAAGSIRRLQSGLGLAFQLAESAAVFDDWRETFRFSERLRAVTAADIQRVAGDYLTRENRTVATLVKKEAR